MGRRPLPSSVGVSQPFGSFPGGFNPPGGHPGTDYAAALNTKVIAIQEGRVLWADWARNMPGGKYDYHLRWLYDKDFPGILVILEHDDVLSSPAHLNRTDLNAGQWVAQGQVVGLSGNTGTATTGPHTHFEIIRKPFNWATPTYGRVDPGPYTREPYVVAGALPAPAPVPVAGSPWLDGATRELQPLPGALDKSLPVRATWHITSDVDPGKVQPTKDAVGAFLKRERFCPHLLWDPFTGSITQYYPATAAARALKAWNEDGAVHVQIEILFSRGAVRLGKQYWNLTDTPLLGFDRILHWLDSLGIPRTWPMGPTPPVGTSGTRDVAVWNSKAGHYGHSQVPDNDHTDPGIMPDITAVGPPLGAATTTTPQGSANSWGIEEILKMSQTQFNDMMDTYFRQNKGKAGSLAWGVGNGRDHAASANENAKLSAYRAATTHGLLRGLPASILQTVIKRPDKTDVTLASAVSYERENWTTDRAKQDAILAEQKKTNELLAELVAALKSKEG